MSYATCISVRQYNSKEEKEKVHALAFSKLIEYIYGDFGTGHSRFLAKEWIREQCEIISDELEDKTKFVDTDYEDLSSKRQEAFVTDLLKTFRNESSNWKNAAKYVRLDGEGKVCWTPCVVDQSYRDEISWLCEIVNNYNWDCIDVILCGY